MNITLPGADVRNVKQDEVHGAKIKNDNLIPSGAPAKGTAKSGDFAASLAHGENTILGDGTKKSSAEELLNSAREADHSVARNMDIVLSNTLSGEDYKQAKEVGFDPREIDADEAATIVDHIKAALIKGGTEVIGYTDDISDEALTNMTGSAAYANALRDSFHSYDVPVNEDNADAAMKAVELAQSITEISDAAVRYLVENNMRPSPENLYLAVHSASAYTGAGGTSYYAEQGGYLTERAQAGDLEGLAKDIAKVVEEAGFDKEDAGANALAKDFVSSGIALTPENLRNGMEIKTLSFPLKPEQVFDAAASAIAKGKAAETGDLVRPENPVKEAVRLFAEAEAPAVEAPVVEAPAVEVERPYFPGASLRNLRETMYVQSNLESIRTGVPFSNVSIEQMVDRLQRSFDDGAGTKAVYYEETVTQKLSAQHEGMQLFYEATFKVAYLRTEAPIGVIGALKDEFKTDTLDDIFTGATTWRPRYEQAKDLYETFGTEVRSDLGDKISKAFGNMDSLMKELGISVNEDNRRAVRILSYNRMELNTENVERVSAVDAKLRSVVNDLKPGVVLDMIREGKNPLTMTLDELSEYLGSRNSEGAAADEKYAKFLYKLEQNGAITPEERTSFVGIYRMFHTIQQRDGAAIGAVLQTGAEMTIKNLLAATRTEQRARAGIDFTADDASDGIRVTERAESITSQVDTAFTYYRAKADLAFANLEPEKMLAMGDPEGATLPAFAEAMVNLPVDEELEAAYHKRTREETHASLQRADAEEGLEDTLRTLELPVSANNLEALAALRASGRRDSKRSLFEEVPERAEDAEGAKKAVSDLFDALDREEDYPETYERTLRNLREAVGYPQERADIPVSEEGYLDVRAMSLLNRQLSIAARMADRQSEFEIPVEADGRTVSMHVSLREGGTSGVNVSMETETLGALNASFGIDDGSLSGTIATSLAGSRTERSGMEEFAERFVRAAENALPGVTASANDLTILYQYGAEGLGTQQTDASRRTLFTIAKAFAETVIAA